jgi:hypothetical protein
MRRRSCATDSYNNAQPSYLAQHSHDNSVGKCLTVGAWSSWLCQYISWAGVKTKDGFFRSPKAIAYAKSHATKVVCCLCCSPLYLCRPVYR